MNEEQMEGAQDFLNEHFWEGVVDRLEQIVEENEGAILKILGSMGYNVTFKGKPI